MAKKKNITTTTGQYDKVFKENADEIHVAIINRLFQMKIGKAQTENIPQSDLHYTIERKADFLKKILPTDGSSAYCLHIEIKSTNDEKMEWRMHIYRGLISHKYQMHTVQFVVYIGNDPLTMQSVISEEKLEFSYEIIDIRRYNYEEFLNTNTPEEVILAVLGDFHGEKAETVIAQILNRLQQLTSTQLAFGKYATQLEVISELRELRQITKTHINNMPVVFDYTTTTAFEKGEIQGMVKGEAKNQAKTIEKMLRKGLTPEQIVDILEVEMALVLSIQANLT
jgi:hypothetical protein